MAQIRNRFDIQNNMQDEASVKRLPNFFIETDEVKPAVGLALSVVFHIVFLLTKK